MTWRRILEFINPKASTCAFENNHTTTCVVKKLVVVFVICSRRLSNPFTYTVVD